MKIIFYGTPDLCIPYLESLQKSGLTPTLIVTNPDRPVGRKQTLTPPPTKIWAQTHNLPVYQPEKLREDAFSYISEFKPDLQIVIAYGKIIPERLISLPKFGTINVHYSILPRWRGASPVEATILAGDLDTGICVQQMQYELDSGPILTLKKIPLQGTEYSDTLKMYLSNIGAPLLTQTIGCITNGTIIPMEQDSTLATFCYKIKKSDGEILPTDTDEMKWRKYRAYHGWPGVFYIRDGKRTKITDAQLQTGKFIITKIIQEGGIEKSIL